MNKQHILPMSPVMQKGSRKVLCLLNTFVDTLKPNASLIFHPVARKRPFVLMKTKMFSQRKSSRHVGDAEMLQHVSSEVEYLIRERNMK